MIGTIIFFLTGINLTVAAVYVYNKKGKRALPFILIAGGIYMACLLIFLILQIAANMPKRTQPAPAVTQSFVESNVRIAPVVDAERVGKCLSNGRFRISLS